MDHLVVVAVEAEAVVGVMYFSLVRLVILLDLERQERLQRSSERTDTQAW